VRHGTCFHRRLSTHHAGAAPHSAVAELGVVSRCYAHFHYAPKPTQETKMNTPENPKNRSTAGKAAKVVGKTIQVGAIAATAFGANQAADAATNVADAAGQIAQTQADVIAAAAAPDSIGEIVGDVVGGLIEGLLG